MKLDELEAKANGALEWWKSGVEITVDAAVVLKLIALLREAQNIITENLMAKHARVVNLTACQTLLIRLDADLEKP